MREKISSGFAASMPSGAMMDKLMDVLGLGRGVGSVRGGCIFFYPLAGAHMRNTRQGRQWERGERELTWASSAILIELAKNALQSGCEVMKKNATQPRGCPSTDRGMVFRRRVGGREETGIQEIRKNK